MTNFTASSSPDLAFALNVIAWVFALIALVTAALRLALYTRWERDELTWRQLRNVRIRIITVAALVMTVPIAGVTLTTINLNNELAGYEAKQVAWAHDVYGVTAGAEDLIARNHWRGDDGQTVIIDGKLRDVILEFVGEQPVLIDPSTKQQLPHHSE